MAKRTKNKSKQRKKRYLRQRIFKATKAVPTVTVQAAPPVKLYLGKYTDVNVEYQNALDSAYGEGKVKPYGRYVSPQATLRHYCIGCSKSFYGKPEWMLGSVYPHVCFSRPSTNGQYNSKPVKKDSKAWDDFYKMVWEDLSPAEIAKKMNVNPNIIKEYFVREGLM